MNSPALDYLIEVAGGLWLRFSLDVSFKGALVLLLGFLFYQVFRRSSSALRHLVLTLSFLCLFLLPLGLIIEPDWSVPVIPAPAISVGIDGFAGFSGTTVAAVLFLIWFTGFLLVLLRLAIGLRAVRRMIRESVPVEDEAWMRLNVEIAAQLKLRRIPSLLMSPTLGAALCAGLFRPTVLLPVESEEWSEEQRRVILRHEMGHMRRRDNQTNVLAIAVCAVYWFNPLVWWSAERLRICREAACDDLVLSTGVHPSRYVSFLLDVGHSRKPGLVSVGLSQISALKKRLLSILDPAINRSRPDPVHFRVGLAFAMTILFVVAAVQPWATAPFQGGLSHSRLGLLGPAELVCQLADQLTLTSRPAGPLAYERGFVRHPSTFALNAFEAMSGQNRNTPLSQAGATTSAGFHNPAGWSRSEAMSSGLLLEQSAGLAPTWPGVGRAFSMRRAPVPPTDNNPDDNSSEPQPDPSPNLQVTRLSLGTLGGASSAATDINEGGLVVGESTTEYGNAKPFLWQKGAGLHDLPCPASDCSAIDVNNNGQILVIASDGTPATSRSYLWSPDGGLVDLGTLGGQRTLAVALNDKGHVAGSSETSYGVENAFFWSPENGMVNLGGQKAVALNERGQVVGWTSSYAFLWDASDGAFSRIGPVGVAATPLDLNNEGEVVGFALSDHGTTPTAFHWSASTGLAPLDFPGEEKGSYAFRVNDAGEMLTARRTEQGQEVFLHSRDKSYRRVEIPSALVPRIEWDEVTSPSESVILIGSNLPSFQLAEEIARIDFQAQDPANVVSQPVKMNGRGQIAGNLIDSDRERVEAVLWEIRLLDVEQSINQLKGELDSLLTGQEEGQAAKLQQNLEDALQYLRQNDYQKTLENLTSFLENLDGILPSLKAATAQRWIQRVWTCLDRLSEFTVLQ